MVFIDGAHEYEWVKKDVDLWFPKARKMICGHDIGEKGVREAVENLQEKYLLSRSFKSGPGTIWSIEI
jgi:hypothetical protein